MHRRLSHLSLVASTLILSVASCLPLTGTTPGISGAFAQTPTNQDRKAEGDRLFRQGKRQYRQGQYREALRTLEQVLVIRRETGDRAGEGTTLNSIGVVYYSLKQYPKVLEYCQQALAIRREVGDKKGEGETLTGMGLAYQALRQYPKALEYYSLALAIDRELGDKKGESADLKNIADVYEELEQYPKALEHYQQALAIKREISDKKGEGQILNYIGAVYRSLEQYPKALEYHQQALAIKRELGDKKGEGTTLTTIAFVYSQLGEYPKALEYAQQALPIQKELGDKEQEWISLITIAQAYFKLGQHTKALEYYSLALAIDRESDDKEKSATLISIAKVYEKLGQYAKALEYYHQALAIARNSGYKKEEGVILNSTGLVYEDLDEYAKALEFYQQALAINRELGDKKGEGKTLNNIGKVYNSLDEYAKALEYFQQALVIRRQVGDKEGEGTTLGNIGVVYKSLGQYPQALEYLQQALAIAKKVGNKEGEGTTLDNIGKVYGNLKQYPKALEYLQQALVIRKEIGDKKGEGVTLHNIGLVYDKLEQYAKALEYYQQSLALKGGIGSKEGEAATLNNIGEVYREIGQYVKALEYYQQALAIIREIGSKQGEGTTLSNIGYLLNKQNQPELAIVFYKQSVNVTETIRQDLRVLPQEQQKSYTETVAGRYRNLANLLLSQGRILEAQQVLELLKIQELRDYTRNAKAGGQTSGIALNPTEEQIIKSYGSLIAFGNRIDECKKTQCSELSQLNQQLQALTQQYNQTVVALKKVISDRLSKDRAFLNPETLSGRKAREIVESQPGTVLIYPLVLEDKIWLVWASSGGIIKSLEVPVSQRKLGETALKFRELLATPTSNIDEVNATGKQLYDWLIKPIETELKANKIQNLVFSLDRVTRYIPMSALFDGQKYLIENYTVSTVLSADLTDMRDRLPQGTQNISVLALGLSNEVAGFDSLPNVPIELDSIVRNKPTDSQGIYPGLKFLNNAFNFQALRDNLLGKNILHIATHGQFVAGRPEDSFILLGTGEKLSIPQIETLQDLGDVHLVVLSACETGLGGPDREGLEISGISYYFLNKGAKAVMASLWQVNDKSTSLLMQNFYTNIANETAQTPMTKAAALRQAQLNLLQGNPSPTNNVEQRGIVSAVSVPTKSNFPHPHYWAPFILIGNGL